MVPRLVLVCLVFAICQCTACGQGQGTANDSPTLAGLAKQQADMQAELGNLRSDIAEIKTAIAGYDLVPIRPVPGPNNPPAKTLEERVKELEDAQLDMQNVQRNHGVALGQIAMQGETGDYHVRFDTNSQSARNEVKRAIKNAVPRRGDFIIRNKTRWHQNIIVNGYQYHILPYETLPLQVQPGAVVSRLPGQQSYTWQVGLPDFKQVIELEEREPTYVARWVGY